MDVTLLYFDDCPNWLDADPNSRRAGRVTNPGTTSSGSEGQIGGRVKPNAQVRD